MKISIVAALSTNNVIGSNNDLPWHVPEDLAHFKQLTQGCPIIMGRNTFNSLPGILPNRHHIVLSSGHINHHSSVSQASSVWEALDIARTINHEAFVVGGSTIYEQFLKIVDYMFITKIHMYTPGDVFFPVVAWDEWEQISVMHVNSKIPCDFVVYKRK